MELTIICPTLSPKTIAVNAIACPILGFPEVSNTVAIILDLEILPTMSSPTIIWDDPLAETGVISKVRLFWEPISTFIVSAIDSLNPFEEKRDYFATSILAESINLQFDSEGRISLSSKLLKHAKIKNSMLFVGQGQTFQIWEPTAFEKFKVTARKKANINRGNLKWELQQNKQ